MAHALRSLDPNRCCCRYRSWPEHLHQLNERHNVERLQRKRKLIAEKGEVNEINGSAV